MTPIESVPPRAIQPPTAATTAKLRLLTRFIRGGIRPEKTWARRPIAARRELIS